MHVPPLSRTAYVLFVLIGVALSGGCHGHRYAHLFYNEPPPPPVLGTFTDRPFQMQEENAEASKFIVYDHEFQVTDTEDGQTVGTYYLNEDGQDHLRKVAESLRHGASYPVIVERSRSSAKPDTAYQYPVHFNPELDNQRREIVVKSLEAMGIENAEHIVVVAPALAPGLNGFEAERAYRAATASTRFGQGLGGGFGFLGGFGGFGFGGSGF